MHGGLDASRVVLGDFGEVYVVAWNARDGGAPEQARGADPTIRSDVFALGALFLVALPIFALVVGVRDWSAVVFVVVSWALACAGFVLQRRAPALSLIGFAVAMALGQVLGAPARARPYVPLMAAAAIGLPAFLAQAHVLDVGGFDGTPERSRHRSPRARALAALASSRSDAMDGTCRGRRSSR